MPMGLGEMHPDILLVKCHHRRMVLNLEDLHIPRNVPRYARGLTVSVDQSFSTVLDEIDRYHHDSCISPALADAFRILHDQPHSGVQFHTVEVGDPEAPLEAPPVAGELGYTVGGVYTSLSGYHIRNGSGWVQMGALGCMLRTRRAAFWDLGMDIPYKRRLGATPVDRSEFLHRYRAAADTPDGGEEHLLTPVEAISARELVVGGSVSSSP
jgi:leucyl/phenylalanyl-tRNA--protein transferase